MSAGWWALPELPLLGQQILESVYQWPRKAKRGAELMRWVIHFAHQESSRISFNEGYFTRPQSLASAWERAGELGLNARSLVRKLRGRSSRPNSDRYSESVRPSYRMRFGDWFTRGSFRSAILYDDNALEGQRRELDLPAGSSRALNLMVGLEAAVRAATQLRV